MVKTGMFIEQVLVKVQVVPFMLCSNNEMKNKNDINNNKNSRIDPLTVSKIIHMDPWGLSNVKGQVTKLTLNIERNTGSSFDMLFERQTVQ